MAHSPLDILIDQATGYDPTKHKLPEMITLYCPKCKRRQNAPKHDTDPDGTATVRVKCPKCDPGDFELVEYFDSNGNQILPI